MTEQAEYFAQTQEDSRMKWQAAFIMFIAFDFVAATLLPMAVRTAPLTRESPQYRKVLLQPKVVQVCRPDRTSSFSTYSNMVGVQRHARGLSRQYRSVGISGNDSD